MDRELEGHPGISGSATALHEMRIAAVIGALLDAKAGSVLDLGCGEGELMVRLAAQTQFSRIVGIDISDSVLQMARCLLGLDPFAPPGRVEVLHASFTEPDSALNGFDAAVLLETIEHIDPGRLSRVERAVFSCYRPRTVLITTPNHEYNVMYGMTPGQFRHPGHCFEWDRSRFRHWACGVAQRNGYSVAFHDIGTPHPALGASTQMAIFALIADAI
ncbi:MAG: methyltransferase domain-containing protein [Sideroxydans sp.]|jgi:3' terminal RNA ribose 2'-O-methyltransferase Hen1